MTRGARIVDERSTVQNVEQFAIAIGGEAKSVAEGYVAHLGVIRQFWPSTLEADNPIVMTTDTELSYATKMVGEGIVYALCNWDANTGRLVLSDVETVRYVDVLAPPTRGAGNYVLRVNIVSGDLTTEFPTGEWHDVFEYGNLGVFENYLLNGFAAQSVLEGEALVSIAEDDGAGAPLAGTQVDKTVLFKAEVVGDNLSFTTAPWTLEDVQFNQRAYVTILTVPSGFGNENEAFATGNENTTEVVREIYAVEWGPQFTVQVDVLAGAVIGDATGVVLSTNVRRAWVVEANNPDDSFTATVNMTISDGINSVTKQITMTATQSTDVGEIGSNVDDDFTRFDYLEDNHGALENNPDPLVAQITLQINIDGTLDGFGLQTGRDVNFLQNWNTLAPATPDPENFEAQLTQIEGDPLYIGSDATGIWLNLAVERSWFYYDEEAAINLINRFRVTTGKFQLEVREVGRPETVKAKQVTMSTILYGNEIGPIP